MGLEHIANVELPDTGKVPVVLLKVQDNSMMKHVLYGEVIPEWETGNRYDMLVEKYKEKCSKLLPDAKVSLVGGRHCVVSPQEIRTSYGYSTIGGPVVGPVSKNDLIRALLTGYALTLDPVPKVRCY